MKNLALEKFRNGQTLTNAWLSIPNSWSAELVAKAGFDVITVDAQHGLANDLSVMLPMAQAIKNQHNTLMARVPRLEAAFPMRLLDAGFEGLICPMINTAKDAEDFVKYTTYPPKGIRSFGPTRAGVVYDYSDIENVNQEIIRLIQIETAEGYKNIREIAKVEGLTGMYVGPWDLSLSLGLNEMANFESPVFLDILTEIAQVGKEHNLLMAIHAGNPGNALKMKDLGFQFLTMFNDSTGLKNAAKNDLNTFLNQEKSTRKTEY
jgi:4-hydroxy-2-oxoheptanedioate aldolase